jgi:hypothetical protein
MPTKKPFYARLEGSSWGCLDVTFGGMLLKHETPKGFPTDEHVALEAKEFEPLFEKLKDVRKRLQTELENCPEVSEVTDLYSKEDSPIVVGLGISTLDKSEFSGTFSPLVAILQLPTRMQPIARRIPLGTAVDRFVNSARWNDLASWGSMLSRRICLGISRCERQDSRDNQEDLQG